MQQKNSKEKENVKEKKKGVMWNQPYDLVLLKNNKFIHYVFVNFIFLFVSWILPIIL